MTSKEAIKDIEATAKALEKKQAELQKAQNIKAIVDAKYNERRKKVEAHYKELLSKQLGKLFQDKTAELQQSVDSLDTLGREINSLKKRIVEITNSIINPSEAA